MGYPMARNLRVKIPVGDSLVIYDVDKNATKRFLEEMGIVSGVVVANSVCELADQSVCFTFHPPILYFLFAIFYDEYVPQMNILSWWLRFGVAFHDLLYYTSQPIL